jgi:hypothetical protein
MAHVGRRIGQPAPRLTGGTNMKSSLYIAALAAALGLAAATPPTIGHADKLVLTQIPPRTRYPSHCHQSVL